MANSNTCVVCGRTSTRATWNTNINGVDGNNFPTVYVACDFHSLNEVESAVLAAGGSPSTGGGIINQDPAVQEAPQT